ncbi:type II toxin-antitoxin system VapC family toxin [Legionella brunensis]|uniref:Toxin FitB n=1 Tax=Legionella brunensis TaxID=29422 RepID=A0A0W0SSZ5_9GAMM|nr:type II toxin-antitoxin system VapC family toxin [Legionella brunensis]KTC86387.1 Toxin FitB [Legionella brunensis]
MKYLLDTNIISELVKPRPNERVVQWVGEKDSSILYISVITLGEIRKGIGGITDSLKYEKISQYLETELPNYFEDRILSIDRDVAGTWGQIQSQSKSKPLTAIDSLIAATAKVHNLKLVTRNTKDFINTPIDLLNPWE